MKSLKEPESLAAQHRRFVETARALGCDEDKDRFEAKLGEIARHKPPPKSEKTTKKSKPA